MKLKSTIDFLNYYLRINEEKCKEYIQKGRGDQLHRIGCYLYRRYHRKRAERAMKS